MYLRNGFGRLEPPDGDRVVEKPKNYYLGEEHLPPGRKKKNKMGPSGPYAIIVTPAINYASRFK
jgi:hypothetical protein